MEESRAYELGQAAFADGKWKRFSNDAQMVSMLEGLTADRKAKQVEIADWERGWEDAKAAAKAPKKKKKVSKKKAKK